MGGLWNVSADTTSTDLLDTEMPTNISRYTCSFSDLAWESVDLKDDNVKKSDALPMFPKARHMKRYLQTYAERYIPSEYVGTGCTVVEASQVENDHGVHWSVRWEGPPGKFKSACKREAGSCQAIFDCLVIASGFFAEPKKLDVPGVQSSGFKVKHSSKLRNLDQDLADGGRGKIVIVGGSVSGVDAAATVALQLSSSKHSPGNQPDYSNYTVHHVTSRPFWILPPYIPRTALPEGNEIQVKGCPDFTPIEIPGKDLSNRPEDMIMHKRTDQVSPAIIRTGNDRLSKSLGTSQARIGDNVLSFHSEGRLSTQLPWVAINSTYAEFVRSGDITVHLGSAVSLDQNSLKTLGEKPIELDDLSLLITATGFEPHAALSFLAPEVLESLGHDPYNDYQPLLLDEYAMTNLVQPQLGFVGFYRGPFFGVMEMQARYLGKLWSNQAAILPCAERVPRSLSAETHGSLSRGQFPMADYVGLMESLARRTGVHRIPFPGVPETNARGQGIVIAARYPSPSITAAGLRDVESTLTSLARTIGINPSGPSTAVQDHNLEALGPATFRALQGKWDLLRSLTSALPEYPSGTFRGTATLLPRKPTAADVSAEMLYVEDGELTTLQGFVMRGSRRYVYRLKEGEGISCWFVKADGLSVDYLFHAISFEEDDQDGWKAVGSSHLCIEDNYESDYRFHFVGIDVQNWELGYEVKGPRKDYFTKSVFTRT